MQCTKNNISSYTRRKEGYFIFVNTENVCKWQKQKEARQPTQTILLYYPYSYIRLSVDSSVRLSARPYKSVDLREHKS